MRENLSHGSLLASGGLLAIFGVPGLVAASPHLCLRLHMALSLCARLSCHVAFFLYPDMLKAMALEAWGLLKGSMYTNKNSTKQKSVSASAELKLDLQEA